MKGVAVLYRWTVSADRQRQFVQQWRGTALQLRKLGAVGSSLLRSDGGEFIALVRWPSEYARERAYKAEKGLHWPSTVGEFSGMQLSVEADVASGFPVPLGLAL
jgi:hypothetical protein